MPGRPRIRPATSGRTGDWRTHPYRECPGCSAPCQVTHKATGKCVTCTLPILRAERAAAAALPTGNTGR